MDKAYKTIINLFFGKDFNAHQYIALEKSAKGYKCKCKCKSVKANELYACVLYIFISSRRPGREMPLD